MAYEYDKTKYADLNKLSTEALKDIIRADFTSDDMDDDYVMRALEVITQREEQADGTVDVNAAWESFCDEYCTEEGTGLSLYDSSKVHASAQAEAMQVKPKRFKTTRSVLKCMGLTAAVMALLLAGIVAVQAAGVDIFGAIARWTEEVFHFESTGDISDLEWTQELCDYGVPSALMPTWTPEGFETSESRVDDFTSFTEVWQSFSNPNGQYFDILITVYDAPEYISSSLYQKDDSPIEEYQSNGRTVYLFANLDKHVATCVDGLTKISVVGDLTQDQLKQIFDSIGG